MYWVSWRSDAISERNAAPPTSSIDDPAEAATQAVRLATGDLVRTLDGADIRVAADTLCVHGDGPRAVEIATAARRAVLAAGIAIRPA